MTNPAAEGFRMPAEWEPHTRTWMGWPCREEVWGDRMEAAATAYADVARAIAEFEPVTMVCNPADVAEASLALGSGIEILSAPIDDSWLRDSGPTFLVDGKGALAAADWKFNAWGEKYKPYDQDAALAALVIEKVGARRFEAPFVLEGGAIHVDGEGTALVTEQCLLNPNRNTGMAPDPDKPAVERGLMDYLGVGKVIWLGEGLEDDETDGHIDELACFARPGLVMITSPSDTDDPDYATVQDNVTRLKAATDARGRALEIVELPQPARRDYPDGGRITLSYVNFYMPNGGIVMPAFDVADDRAAFRIMKETFPDRKIVQVPASDIAWGGGGIHCITQQQPEP